MKPLHLALTASLLATACATAPQPVVEAKPAVVPPSLPAPVAVAAPAQPVTPPVPSPTEAEGLDAAATVSNWQAQQGQRIARLAEASARLQDSVQALCKRLRPEQIEAARQAWKDSQQAWRAVEALPMGPALSRRTAWQIDVWPSRPPKVEEAVRLVSKDAIIADSVGAAAQGLPALEYLLWGEDRASAQLGRLHFRQRCQYSMALAGDIASEAAGLRSDWQAYAATTLDHDAGRQAFEEGVNLIAGAVQNLRDKKLARQGSVKAAKKPSRQDFDAWRSHQTRAGLAATLGALDSLFQAPGADGSPSFLKRLADAGRPLLAQHLHEELAVANAALARLPDDVASAASRNPQQLKPFLDSLKRLQGLIELQVADAVGVTIGFKDSDGD